MRFTSFIVAGAFAVAARAQTTTAPESPEETTGSPTVSLDPVQSSIIACLDRCDPTDVGCLADCNPVPSPNEDQALDTIDCVAQCEQGNGTEEETAAYIACSDRCINEHFFRSSEGTPNPTGGNNENSNDPNSTAAADATTTSGSETNTTGSSDPEQTSTNSESPTESGAETPAGTNGESNPEETGSGDSGAATLVGSALIGGLALVLAL